MLMSNYRTCVRITTKTLAAEVIQLELNTMAQQAKVSVEGHVYSGIAFQMTIKFFMTSICGTITIVGMLLVMNLHHFAMSVSTKVDYNVTYDLVFEQNCLVVASEEPGHDYEMDECDIPECGDSKKPRNATNFQETCSNPESRNEQCSTEQFSCQPGECIYR